MRLAKRTRQAFLAAPAEPGAEPERDCADRAAGVQSLFLNLQFRAGREPADGSGAARSERAGKAHEDAACEGAAGVGSRVFRFFAKHAVKENVIP